MPTISIDYGTDVQMTVTNLNSLASSATAGWQSDRVDNTTTKALDYQINFKIDLANTAAANDKAIYVYAVPWFYDGSTWTCGADGGTATPPSGTQGTYTIGATHNLKRLAISTYTTTDQVVYGQGNISSALGDCPHGWSLVIIDYTGAAIAASGNVVQYVPIKYTSA